MLVNEIILEHIFISDTQHFAQTAQSSKLTQIKHDSIQQRQGQVQCHHVTQFFITEWAKGNWFPELTATSATSLSDYCPGENHLEQFTCFAVSIQ